MTTATILKEKRIRLRMLFFSFRDFGGSEEEIAIIQKVFKNKIRDIIVLI